MFSHLPISISMHSTMLVVNTHVLDIDGSACTVQRYGHWIRLRSGIVFSWDRVARRNDMNILCLFFIYYFSLVELVHKVMLYPVISVKFIY